MGGELSSLTRAFVMHIMVYHARGWSLLFHLTFILDSNNFTFIFFSFSFYFLFFALAVRLLSYELQTRMSVDTAFSTLHIS